MKKIKIFLLLVLTSLLTACDSSVERAERTVSLMQDAVGIVTSELNSIQNLEEGIQSQFEQAIEADESMQIFNSSDSPVEKNIQQRQDSIKKIEKSREELTSLASQLAELKRNKNLPAEDITNIENIVTDLSSSLETYVNDYKNNAALESQAYKSLANPENDYQNFFGVIEDVNVLSVNNLMNLEKILGYFEPLNINLVNLKVYLVNLQGK